MNRDFKGVWIPAQIYLNRELTLVDKILLVEIDSLDNGEGCYASNRWLADFLNVSEWKISQGITKLEKLGFVERVNFDGRRRIVRSRLRELCLDEMENISSQPWGNHKAALGKPQGTRQAQCAFGVCKQRTE